MLRHSLYKKFGKKSFQVGGQDPLDANPYAEVVGPPAPPAPGTLVNNNPNQPYPLDFANPNDQRREDISWGPTREEPNVQRPSSPYDQDMYKIPDYNMPTEQQKFSKSDELTKGIQPDSAQSNEPGFFQKAWDYTKDNWQDMATMGLLGVRGVLNYKDDIRKDRNLNRAIQQRGVDSNPLYDYNWMYGRTTSGGTEYQPTIMAQDGMNLNNRLPMNNSKGANVEIEGGEFLILPDGTTELAKGPSHKNGGIDTVLPEGTKVFSNHLKPSDLHKMKAEQKFGLVQKYAQEGGDLSMGMGLDYLDSFVSKDKKQKFKDREDDYDYDYPKKWKNRTFAELAKAYDFKSFQEILDNPFASAVDKSTAQLLMLRNQNMLDQLFRDQQILNGNSSGEPMPTPQERQQSGMRDGGINNPGFRALPPDVQQKIMKNMEEGGYYMQDAGTVPPGYQISKKDGKYYDPVKQKYYKLDPNTQIKRGDDPNLEVGDYIVTENGTIRKVSKKDVTQIQKGFNRDYATMKERFMAPELEEVREAMYQRYLQDPDKKGHDKNITKEQFFNNYLKTQEQLYRIQDEVRKDPELAKSIREEDWDKVAGGMKNKKYNELAKKLGMEPLQESEIAMFQAGYKDLAYLQQDPNYSEALKDFDLTPKGVGDDTYLGKAISGEDTILGNTTVQQLQYLKNMEDQVDLGYEDLEYLPEETPPGGEYTIKNFKRADYVKTPYPIDQSIPGMYALGQDTYNYVLPEVDAPYLRPQTLNVQSQLQDINNTAIAMARLSPDTSPLDLYNAGIQQQDIIYNTKQKADIGSRSSTDIANVEMLRQADMYNADMLANVMNEQVAGAKAAQGETRQEAINNLVTNRNKWKQSENTKKFYFDNFAPNLAMDKDGKIIINPTSTPGVSWGPSTGVSTSTVPAGATQTGPNTASTGWQQTSSETVRTAPPTQADSPVETTQVPAGGSPQTTSPQQTQEGNWGPWEPLDNTPVGGTPLNLPGNRPDQQWGMKMGGEMEHYLNPFKKKKSVRGFRKKK